MSRHQGSPIHPRGDEREPRVKIGQVRGVLADKVVYSTMLDPFMGFTALAQYSGLSKSKLRLLIDDPLHPLPAFQIGGRDGKILVRRSEFDAWMLAHHRRQSAASALVAKVLDEVKENGRPEMSRP